MDPKIFFDIHKECSIPVKLKFVDNMDYFSLADTQDHTLCFENMEREKMIFYSLTSDHVIFKSR